MNKGELLARYAAGERGFARVDLSGLNLSGADLSFADFSRADFSGVGLWRADLSEVNLAGADLSGADLWRANLTGANLTGANLWRAILAGANLSGARLTSRTARGGWPFVGTVWPTDPELLAGTTMDGVPFLEWVQTLDAIGPNPSTEVLAAWDAMNAAKQAQSTTLTAALNDAPRAVDR